MIGCHLRKALNHLNYQRRIIASRSLSVVKTMNAELCDVYSTRLEDGKLYLSVADTRNEQHVTDNTIIETIPETVLQFERQTRKAQAAKRAEADVTTENHLHVVYQDEYLVATDKPSGVLCVPGLNKHSSLLAIVHEEFASTIQPMNRLIVHRLDMDTSGLVIFGRTLLVVTKLHKVFRERKVVSSRRLWSCEGGLRQDRFAAAKRPRTTSLYAGLDAQIRTSGSSSRTRLAASWLEKDHAVETETEYNRI